MGYFDGGGFNPRLMSIFGGQGAAPNFQLPQFDFTGGLEEEEPMQPYRMAQGGMDWNTLAQLPNLPALERYKQHVESMPRREDYSPGKMDRLAAALAGVSTGWLKGGAEGISAARGALDRPYETAYKDWMSEGAGLKESAGLEQAESGRRMEWLRNNRQAQRDEFEFQLRSAKTEAEIKQIQNNIELSGMRTATDANGNFVVVDIKKGGPPQAMFQTNAETPAERKEGRNLTANSRIRAAQIREQGANNRLGVQFANQKELEKLRTEGDLKVEEKRNEGRLRTPLSEPSASEQKTASDLALRNFAQEISEVTVDANEAADGQERTYPISEFLREDGTLKSRAEVMNDSYEWINDSPAGRAARLSAYDFVVQELRNRGSGIAGRK